MHKWCYTINYNLTKDTPDALVISSPSLSLLAAALADKPIPTSEIKTLMSELQEVGETTFTDADILAFAKSNLINLIKEYDKSNDVDGFTVSGNTLWLDKDTRVGLMLRFNAEKEAGKTDTTLWEGNICIPLAIDNAIKMLYALEVYASACYDKTAEHKSNTSNLSTLDEVLDYNYKLGYPTQICL
jgi:hypothetical protein